MNSWIHGVLEGDEEVNEEEYAEIEEPENESSEEEEACLEIEEEVQNLETVRPGNGWVSFPEPDMNTTDQTNEWDEVKDQMSKETEKANRPGGGGNLFQVSESEKTNPFINSFERGSLPIKTVYNHPSFKQDNNFKPYSVKKSQNPFFGQVQEHLLRRNPFNGSGPSIHPKDPKKLAPQCPRWESRAHRSENNCSLWHPHKQCA